MAHFDFSRVGHAVNTAGAPVHPRIPEKSCCVGNCIVNAILFLLVSCFCFCCFYTLFAGFLLPFFTLQLLSVNTGGSRICKQAPRTTNLLGAVRASIQAPKAARGMGCGRGCPLPVRGQGRGVASPHKIFWFWISTCRLQLQTDNKRRQSKLVGNYKGDYSGVLCVIKCCYWMETVLLKK